MNHQVYGCSPSKNSTLSSPQILSSKLCMATNRAGLKAPDWPIPSRCDKVSVQGTGHSSSTLGAETVVLRTNPRLGRFRFRMLQVIGPWLSELTCARRWLCWGSFVAVPPILLNRRNCQDVFSFAERHVYIICMPAVALDPTRSFSKWVEAERRRSPLWNRIFIFRVRLPSTHRPNLNYRKTS